MGLEMSERKKENIIAKHSRAFRTKWKYTKENQIETGPVYSFCKMNKEISSKSIYFTFLTNYTAPQSS